MQFIIYLQFLYRGHGTYLVESELRASVAGVVEMVNKLIYVRPMKSRCSIVIPALTGGGGNMHSANDTICDRTLQPGCLLILQV